MPGTYSRLLYHVVFSTKRRANLIADSLKPRLYEYLGGIIRGERGVTHDNEFERWANQVASWNGDPAVDLANYKKELTLELMNEKHQPVLRFFLHDCWVSEYTTLPELDANANAVAIENLKLELEGWSRDSSLAEPDNEPAEGQT